MASWKKVIVSGSQAHLQGITASNIPSASNTNVLLYNSQSGQFSYLSTSSIGNVQGSGANTQVTFWTGPNTIAGDAGLTYNAGTDVLTIGNSTFGNNITASGNISASGNLSVTGTSTLTGNSTIGGTLGVTGVTTLTGRLNANGAISTTNITASGNISASGNLSVTGTSTIGGTLAVTGVTTLSSTLNVNSSNGIQTNATTFPLVNNGATTINFGGAATTLNIGATTGTTTVKNSLAVDGNTTLGNASGDSVTVNAQTLSLANQLAATALSSTMLVITSSNRVATQTLGTGVATFLNNPTSANLATAVSDETGTGTLVFSASPTFTGTVGAAAITTTGNVTIGGNLTVNGTTTTIDTTNLTVEDKFIILAHGSGSISPIAEGGIIVEGSTADKGQAFLFNSGSTANVTGRWGLAADVHATSSNVNPTDFMVSVNTAGTNPSAAPTYGGSAGGYGNMYVNSQDESIWIYS